VRVWRWAINLRCEAQTSFSTFGEAERAGACEDLQTYWFATQTIKRVDSQGLCMRIFPMLVVGIAISLAGCGRDPGPKGDPGPQGPPGPKVRRARRGFRELRDRPAPKDRRARKVRQETKAKRAIKAIRGAAGSVNIRAVQADGPVSCEGSERWCQYSVRAAARRTGRSAARRRPIGLCLQKP